MADRLPTPEELWGPDYREHLQRQFDIYDAAVARERAEIAARNAASSHVDGVPSTDLPQAPDLQGRDSHASPSTPQPVGEKLLDSPTSPNAVHAPPPQPITPPEGGVPFIEPQASNHQGRNSHASHSTTQADGEKLVDNSTSPNAIRNETAARQSVKPPEDGVPYVDPHQTQFSTADALKPPPPLEWCVEGLFACPSVSVLVGDPGSKKTFTIIDLAVCVAMGKPWLGHAIGSAASPSLTVGAQHAAPNPLPPAGEGRSPDGERGEGLPVLFIDEQTGPRQLLARFNAALNAHGASAETPIHIHSLAGHALRDRDSADELIKLARSKNARLIIIDAFSNLLRGGSESSLAAVLPALFHLRRIAEACNAAVVVTHHTNRHGSFRGSYAIAAATDLMLSIRSKPDEPTIYVTPLKSRLIAPKPFSARAHFETSPSGTDQFSLTRTADSPTSPDTDTTDPYLVIPPKPEGVVGEAFLVYLDVYYQPNSSFAEIHSRHLAFKQGTLRNCIQQLLDEGVIERSNPGAQEARYSIARPP